MSIERFVEDQIKKAMDEGEFDNLSGKGKPIDLTEYFQLPEDVRVTYWLLKNNQIIPEEAQLVKEINALKEQLSRTSDLEEAEAINRSVKEKTLQFNLLVDARRKKR